MLHKGDCEGDTGRDQRDAHQVVGVKGTKGTQNISG